VRCRPAQIKFVPSLRSWISCCKDRDYGRALFIGDIVALQPNQHHTYYRVQCGVTAFDYSERQTMIVTGGLDALVRLWNPGAVGSKLVGSLEGHVSPVTALIVNNLRNHLISIAENKAGYIQSVDRIKNKDSFNGLFPRTA